MAKQNFFLNEDELDDFQLQLLRKRIDRSMIVSGCAGSGKSILALWKAKQIQDIASGKSYQFIVFTKALHRYMSDGIKAIGLNDDNFIYHYKWIEKGCPSADFIIVDEVQDFTFEEINQFKKAAKIAFFFWGDSAQAIYKNLKSTQNIASIVAEAAPIELDKLYQNYRLPLPIARFAAHFGNDEELIIKCKKEIPDLPKILRYTTLEEQLDVAMQQIKNRGITDSALLFYDNAMVKRAYNYLKNEGYSIEANYRDKQDFRNDMADLNFSSDNPKLMTYHSAKGLQFEAVFMPECNPPEKMGIDPLYVAMTRSYRHLFVMYSAQLSCYFDAVPKDLYLTTLDSEKVAL